MKIIQYPFVVIPNSVIQAKVGALNIGVLALLLSERSTNLSVSEVARELKCTQKDLIQSFAFWLEEGPKHGILIKKNGHSGLISVYGVQLVGINNSIVNNPQI